MLLMAFIKLDSSFFNSQQKDQRGSNVAFRSHSLTFPFPPHEVYLAAWVFLLCPMMLSIGKCWQRELRVLCNGECETPMKACSMRETQGEMEDPIGYSERSLFTKWLPITASAAAGGAHLPRTPGIDRGVRANQNHFRKSLFCSLSFSVQHSLI